MNCWRKSKGLADLDQDVPIEPGMMVYYLHPDRSIERLVVAGENLSRWQSFFSENVIPLSWIATKGPMSKFYYAENTYVTEDAAVIAYEMRLTGGEKASFWARVRKESSATKCWLWAGEVDPEGHGLFKWGKWTYKAHEVAHELARVQWSVGPRCGNKLCCNPGHMADTRTGTPMQNNDETKLRDTQCVEQ